jgi:hypothetical protein
MAGVHDLAFGPPLNVARVFDKLAGLDEGILSLRPPILVCI